MYPTTQQVLLQGLRLLLLWEVDVLRGTLSLTHCRSCVNWCRLSLLFLVVSFSSPQVFLIFCCWNTVAIWWHTCLLGLVRKSTFLNKFLYQMGRRSCQGLLLLCAENLLHMGFQLILRGRCYTLFRITEALGWCWWKQLHDLLRSTYCRTDYFMLLPGCCSIGWFPAISDFITLYLLIVVECLLDQELSSVVNLFNIFIGQIRCENFIIFRFFCEPIRLGHRLLTRLLL